MSHYHTSISTPSQIKLSHIGTVDLVTITLSRIGTVHLRISQHHTNAQFTFWLSHGHTSVKYTFAHRSITLMYSLPSDCHTITHRSVHPASCTIQTKVLLSVHNVFMCCICTNMHLCVLSVQNVFFIICVLSVQIVCLSVQFEQKVIKNPGRLLLLLLLVVKCCQKAS